MMENYGMDNKKIYGNDYDSYIILYNEVMKKN